MMASGPTPGSLELTSWEVTSSYLRRPFIYIRTIFAFLSGILRSKLFNNIPSLHWRQRLALSFLQSKTAVLTQRQRTIGLPTASTGNSIREYCTAKDLPLRSVTVSTAADQPFTAPPAILHFVTPPAAPVTGPTVYYAHGGGYGQPIQAVGHVPAALAAAATIKAKQVVFLEYSLAPRHPYPSQLVQAASGLQALLSNESVKPSEIVAMGDSAGGHLVCSLLAHIAKPSPYALPIDLEDDQLKAAVLISPWVSMTTDQASYDTNDATDFLGRKAAELFKAGFVPKIDEAWANMLDAPDSTEVWNDVFRPKTGKPVVKKALVVAGTAEVLVDSNVEFGKRHLEGASLVVDREMDVAARFPDGDYVIATCVGEAHTQSVLDVAVKYEGGNMHRAVHEFLKRV